VRAFFALWPDDEGRAELHARSIDAAARTRGRPVAFDKLHVTLVFLGDVDDPQAACLVAAAGRLAAGELDLVMSRTGTWRRARIAWLAPESVPGPLERLRESLAGIARGCGVRLESRTYMPHLTLARGATVALPDAPCAPVTLRFHGFCLVRSDLGSGRYEVIGRWPRRREP
jgi:RNA 2',3'-cyclic 3'-phosphodiesterase